VEKVVAETIAVSGEVRGRFETNVGARTSGRVATILVREGQKVVTGQVVAKLDDSVLKTEMRRSEEALRTATVGVAQAEGAVRTAEANLLVASRRPLPDDIAKARAEAVQAEAVAQAKVMAAHERLAELKRGATPEQRDQIAAQVAQAESNLQKAEREALRRRHLYDVGAGARADAEDAETARDATRNALENLRARQREILAGTRIEQIEQAEAELTSAEATLSGARATGIAQVNALLALPRREDVIVAKARLKEAKQALEAARTRAQEAASALSVARERLTETVVTAPFDGTITSVVTEVGGIAGPSQPLVKLVRTGKPEIRISIDEDDLGRVRIGQEAQITASAYPSETVAARVREIGAEVNSSKGQIELRLEPATQSRWLRPGQTVSVNLIIDRGSRRLLLPISALSTAGNVPQVMLVENGKAFKRQIGVGANGPDGIVITSGLTARSVVIATPNAVADGVAVEVAAQ
jgi:HlyD family secretion protein